MRVLHVAASLAGEWGGPVTVLRQLLPRLSRYGVKIELVAPVGLRVGQGPGIAGIRSHSATTSSFAKIWTGYAPGLRTILSRIIPRVDLIHIHELWHYPHWLAYSFAQQHGIPYIVTPHGELAAWRLRYKWWKKVPYLALVQRRILRQAAGIHAITAGEEQDIRRYVGDAFIQIIPNGVDPRQFGPRTGERPLERRYPQLRGRKVILFLGRLHKVKGVDLLAQAFSVVAGHRDDVVLVVAGPDEGAQGDCEDILRRAGVRDKVVFTGMVSGTTKREVLSSADIFVLPSYGDVIGLAVLEAMASGLPVIISYNCQFPEVDREGAGLVIDTNVSQLVRALKHLLDRPDLCRIMGERARQLVEQRFSWDSIVGRVVRFYDDIVSARNRPKDVVL